MWLNALAMDNFVTRSVVLGRGKSQSGTLLAVNWKNLLHRAFSKGFFTDNLGAVIVLEATSDDF